jgi:glycosyltransferase involved in cell wall biosynthesis
MQAIDMEATVQVASRKITESQVIFLVWAAPTFGSVRSRLLARELQMPAPVYLYSTRWKGAWTAPLRYMFHGMQTLRLLFQKRPRVVIVQSPPSFAVLFVALYCKMTNSRYVIDAHSDAFQRGIWTCPQWLYDRITRGAALSLVTDEFFRSMIEKKGGRVMVLRDPVATTPLSPIQRQEQFSVTVVNTFARDEPLEAVLQAAAGLPDVRFSITGKLSRANPDLLRQAPSNAVFTDFLPDEAYYRLLRSSDAVMSLTTRDHTLQCGACEALSLERPIITSAWPLLQEYFCRGTVHVDNTAAGIRQGIESLKQDYNRYEAEVVELRKMRRQEWQQQTAELADLILGIKSAPV